MKIIRIILSIAIVVFWTAFIILTFNSMLPLRVLLIHLFAIPIYLLLFYYFSMWRITKLLLSTVPHVIHIVAVVIYLFFIIFFMRINPLPSEDNKDFYTELLVRYNFANQVHDNIERDYYAAYLDKHFSDEVKHFSDDKLYNTDITFPDFYDMADVFMEHPSLLPSINPTVFYNLNEASSLRAISTLIFKEKFFAARLLIYHHREAFGSNTKIEALLVRVNEYIDRQGISFEEDRLLHLDEQLERLYQVLTNPDFKREDIIAGHHIIQALYNSNSNSTVTWLQALYQKKHDEMLFYAGDVRINLVQKVNNHGVIFVEPGKDGDTIWSANKMSGVEQTVYFNHLDLVFLKRDGTIKWHINTQYAILKGTKLYLTGAERGKNISIYYPRLISGIYPGDEIPWMFDTTVSSNEVRKMVFTRLYANNLNMIDWVASFRIWKKYHLSLDMLYESILNLLIPFMIFVVGGYVMLYIIVSSFLRYKNRAYIYSDPLIPVVLATSTIPIRIFLENVYRQLLVQYRSPYDGMFTIILVLILFLMGIAIVSMLNYKYKRLATISHT